MQIPGPLLADPAWTAQLLRARDPGAVHRRTVATVWWYSLSSVLLIPPLTGLVTGRPVSARLGDTTVVLSGVQPVSAFSEAAGGDTAAELRESLGAVVAAVAEAGQVGRRSLWAIATDSLANRLLDLGRAVGDVAGVTALAGPLAAAVGPLLPAPRYVDIGGTRFVRRASCCLIYETPYGSLCTSCPRRPPAERQALLERAAAAR